MVGRKVGVSMKDRKLNILGLEYNLQELDGPDSEEMYGMINYEDQVIKIGNMMHDDRRAVVLMHEILHGVLDGLGYSDLNNDEEKVQSLANALYQVLKTNPWLFSFFGLR